MIAHHVGGTGFALPGEGDLFEQMTSNDERLDDEDREAIFNVRSRLLAQDHGKHWRDPLDSSIATSMPASSPGIAPWSPGFVPECTAGSRVNSCQSSPATAELGAELIRRRLASQHPCHNPLDSTVDMSPLVPSDDSRSSSKIVSPGSACNRVDSDRPLPCVPDNTAFWLDAPPLDNSVCDADKPGSCGGRSRLQETNLHASLRRQLFDDQTLASCDLLSTIGSPRSPSFSATKPRRDPTSAGGEAVANNGITTKYFLLSPGCVRHCDDATCTPPLSGIGVFDDGVSGGGTLLGLHSGSAPSANSTELGSAEGQRLLSSGTETSPSASSPSLGAAPSSGYSPPTLNSCELQIEDISLLREFEGLNDMLRRHGFKNVSNRLDQLPPGPCQVSPSVAPRARLTVDGRGLWTACAEVVTAYEDRGRRLREALLAERSEDRLARDTRVDKLMREKSKLEEEVKALRHQRIANGSNTMDGDAAAASQRGAELRASECSERAEREIAEMALRVRAAETSTRHREREMEKLKVRLEQALAESAKRKDREREALARPLRRRAAVRDDPLLEVTLAHQARADTLQAEVSSLNRQVHTLSFQLEKSEISCRQLEGQRVFHASGSAVDIDTVASKPQAAMPAALEDLQEERRYRAEVEEDLRRCHRTHAEEACSLVQKLREAEARGDRLEAEKLACEKQPTSLELRLQREVLHLRDEISEARRAWRVADPRALMKRDKDLRALGLDARALEERMSKSELVACLLDVCRSLKVGDMSLVSQKLSDLCEAACALPGLEDFVRSVLEAVRGLDARFESQPDMPAPQPFEALDRLRKLQSEFRDLRAAKTADVARASAAADRRDCQHVPAEVWRALAGELQLPDGTDSSNEVLRRIGELRIGDALLGGLVAQLRCRSANELPQRAGALLRLCDERVAAQRIVDALQKLLCVDRIEAVLPALKDVLDVAALRRRTAKSGASGSASLSVA